MMSAVVDAMWQQAEPTVFITRAEFERTLEGWEIDPVERDGVLLGAVLVSGPDLHFASFGHGAAILLRVRTHIDSMIARHGFVRTRTPKDDVRQRRFNETMGFAAEGEDEFFVHYRMTDPAWRQKCQS